MNFAFAFILSSFSLCVATSPRRFASWLLNGILHLSALIRFGGGVYGKFTGIFAFHVLRIRGFVVSYFSGNFRRGDFRRLFRYRVFFHGPGIRRRIPAADEQRCGNAGCGCAGYAPRDDTRLSSPRRMRSRGSCCLYALHDFILSFSMLP
jgi:hypothetical protein